MMQHQIVVQARYRPETVERVLRVVRHRGFRVCAMTMNMAGDSDKMHIELTVASLRPVDLLFTQLTKLVDINHVEIQRPTPQHICA